MKKRLIKKENKRLNREISIATAKIDQMLATFKEERSESHKDNVKLSDRIGQLLEELIKDPMEREVAQLRLTRDGKDQVIGFTIHAVNSEDISVINNVRDKIFMGGTPNLEYSGRKESSDNHAGILKFTFKEPFHKK